MSDFVQLSKTQNQKIFINREHITAMYLIMSPIAVDPASENITVVEMVSGAKYQVIESPELIVSMDRVKFLGAWG
jgi:hypothetical protein